MKDQLTIFIPSHFVSKRNKIVEKEIHDTIGLKRNLYQIIIQDNSEGKSLTEVYNTALNQIGTRYILFLHNDIQFETDKWGKILLDHFNRFPDFGIIGLAGTTTLTSGQWWEQKHMMVGRVKHHKGQVSHQSNYSGNHVGLVEEVAVIDGIFIAVDKTKLKKEFDPFFDGFHFYDIDFSFANHLEGVKVGVTTDILVRHFSEGEPNKKWFENKVKFEEKYSSKLPYELTPVPSCSVNRFFPKTDNSKVSVCISENDINLASEFIKQITPVYKNIEIIITSNSFKELDKAVVVFTDNTNEAYKLNLAASKAKGKFLLFTNSSCSFEANSIAELVGFSVINDKQNLGVLTGRQYSLDGKINDCGVGLYANQQGQNSLINIAFKTFYNYQTQNVFSVLKTHFFVKKDLFFILDGFNVDYQIDMFNHEFCARALLSNRINFAIENCVSINRSNINLQEYYALAQNDINVLNEFLTNNSQQLSQFITPIQ